MRLYGITPFDVAYAVAQPLRRGRDSRGNVLVVGLDCNGRAIIAIVAKDNPDFVITTFPEG
jgi:hypothetical protein